MDEKEFNALVEKLESASTLKISDTVKEALKGLDQEAVTTLLSKDLATREDIKGLLKAEDIEDVQTQLKEVIESVNTLKDGAAGAGATGKDFTARLKAAIVENFDAIKGLKNNRNGQVQIKVAGPITVGSNLTGRVARAEYEPGSIGVTRRNPFIMDIVNTGRTNASAFFYVERTNNDGGPTMTAEGALKPQADWDYVERSASPKKIPVIVTISKEMLNDVDNIVSDINEEISEQIDLVADQGLLDGDGVGLNLVGVGANATPFAAGALVNTVPQANKLDVLRASVAQVYRQLYVPTFIVVHPDTAASLDLQKGVDGHYNLAPFTSADNMQVTGVRVIVNTAVAADDFYCGDFNKFKVKIREGLSIDVGYRGAAGDWEKNFVSFLGEIRLLSYIPENHFGAIVKGDFTSAIALLLKP